MRNFPAFTTASGVASLTLDQIPYSGCAYIRLQHAVNAEKLLEECCDFCRAVGAKTIYATGDPVLEKYPFHTAIWKMQRLKDGLEETDAALFPLQRQTLEQWRSIYNERMKGVPNAAYMSMEDAEKLLQSGNGYFVHRGDKLLGIGVAAGEQIDAVISVIPGSGEDVTLALSNALSGQRIVVEVASENARALKLYERLGFIKIAELSVWYKIIL